MHIDKFEDLQVKDWRWGFTKSIKSRGVSKICLFLNLEVIKEILLFLESIAVMLIRPKTSAVT